MDHEYSLTGKVWNIQKNRQECTPENRDIKGFRYFLSASGDSLEYDIVPLDKDKVASLSDADVAAVCCEMSLEFKARVRLCKLHEEYGLLNVFNGGSDYEVVASDQFTCEYDKGVLVSQEKVKD